MNEETEKEVEALKKDNERLKKERRAYFLIGLSIGISTMILARLLFT